MPTAVRRRAQRPRRSPPTASTAAERRRVTQELRALAHPLRLRLLEHFAQGPSTTMQVAARMGEPPTRLYHHVNALERAGLLKLRSTRPNRGTTEKYYVVTRTQMGVKDPAQLRGGGARLASGLVSQVFEQARQELHAAITEERGLPLAARMVLSVAPAKQAALRKRLVAALHAIRKEFASPRARNDDTWAVTISLAPTREPSAGERGVHRRR